MPKYAFLGGYTPEAWKGMIDHPESRRAAVEKAAEAAGGKLESFYWTFGEDDFLAIAEAPDDMAAAAVSVGVAASGRLRHMRTIRLIPEDEEVSLLGKAREVSGAYIAPGARTAGVA